MSSKDPMFQTRLDAFINFKVSVLRFPSHEKRKTHTPNTDQRWAMGETAWNVVGG